MERGGRRQVGGYRCGVIKTMDVSKLEGRMARSPIPTVVTEPNNSVDDQVETNRWFYLIPMIISAQGSCK